MALGFSLGVLQQSFGSDLAHRCLCVGSENEHMVFVPVAHEQTLAYDVLEMAQAA